MYLATAPPVVEQARRAVSRRAAFYRSLSARSPFSLISSTFSFCRCSEPCFSISSLVVVSSAGVGQISHIESRTSTATAKRLKTCLMTATDHDGYDYRQHQKSVLRI